MIRVIRIIAGVEVDENSNLKFLGEGCGKQIDRDSFSEITRFSAPPVEELLPYIKSTPGAGIHYSEDGNCDLFICDPKNRILGERQSIWFKADKPNDISLKIKTKGSRAVDFLTIVNELSAKSATLEITIPRTKLAMAVSLLKQAHASMLGHPDS